MGILWERGVALGVVGTDAGHGLIVVKATLHNHVVAGSVVVCVVVELFVI